MQTICTSVQTDNHTSNLSLNLYRPDAVLLMPSQQCQSTEQQQQQPFNGLFSRTTWVSQYQKRKTNLDFTGPRDSEWQWHQLGHMQVCTSLQTDNHASTPPLSFLQAGCPSCRPSNSVKALKASKNDRNQSNRHYILVL